MNRSGAVPLDMVPLTGGTVPVPVLMQPTDIEWPERLAPGSAGRDKALGELRVFLVKGVRTGLSGRSRADDGFIEDVVQTALVRILKHLPRFEGRSAFTTWALAIALRVAFTELRRSHWKNVSLEELIENDNVPLHKIDTTSDPHESAARSSLIAVMHQFIHTKLTPRQQDVLLAQLNDMPQDEIARQMNITRNAAYKLGHDARKALRRALEREGYGVEHVRDVLAGETR